MFNANKLEIGLPAVNTCDELLALLAKSVGYTFGDRFYIGNYKIGSSTVQPDEDHPDWQWVPIDGQLVSLARCLIPNSQTNVVIFTTGYRANDRSMPVLCIWATSTNSRTALTTALSKTEGDTTVGARLATILGYTDWAMVGAEDSASTNKYTRVQLEATGVVTSEHVWLSPVSLSLPDDGGHTYITAYDPYSGLMLMDPQLEVPTMMAWSWDTSHSQSVLTMCKSSYDADYQNTTDIVHAALQNAANAISGHVEDLADETDTDVAGLIAANAALYAAISQMPVFGSKFIDVVEAQERIDASSQYIPRP